MFKRIVIVFTGLLIAGNAYNQKIILESGAVSMDVKNSINLPNPEVFIESPVGKFYTEIITPSCEFPKYSQLHQFSILIANTNNNL